MLITSNELSNRMRGVEKAAASGTPLTLGMHLWQRRKAFQLYGQETCFQHVADLVPLIDFEL